jgi:putative redox protein
MSPAEPARKTTATVRVTWAGAHRFDTGRPAGPVARLDSSGETGQSPVDALLSALATCSAVDVVDILEKRRTPLEDFTIDVAADRAEAIPGRLTRVVLHYRIDGDRIERTHAENAVNLALTKYCSVRNSLDPDLPIAFTVTVNGEAGHLIDAGRAAGTTPTEPMPA